MAIKNNKLPNRELVEKLKVQWKQLWSNRVKDLIRAESVATLDYSSLFIEKGTVIHATRDFKISSFNEILRMNKIENSEHYISPPSEFGGWTKFAKNHLMFKRTRKENLDVFLVRSNKQKQHLKKSGRGWLHK